jgi:hypothetical protein
MLRPGAPVLNSFWLGMNSPEVLVNKKPNMAIAKLWHYIYDSLIFNTILTILQEMRPRLGGDFPRTLI